MLKIIAALTFAAFAGCQTASKNVLQEPERSQYYYYCISNGIHVTTCQCMEDKAVGETGTTGINDLPAGDPTVVKFLEVLEAAIPACQEETDKLLKDVKAGE